LKDVVTLLLTTTDTLTRVLLSATLPDSPPIVFESALTSIYYQRQSVERLHEANFTSERVEGSVSLPNQTAVFGNESSIAVVNSKGDQVRSAVLSLDFFEDNGERVEVKDTSEPLVFYVKNYDEPGFPEVVFMNDSVVAGNGLSYHKIPTGSGTVPSPILLMLVPPPHRACDVSGPELSGRDVTDLFPWLYPEVNGTYYIGVKELGSAVCRDVPGVSMADVKARLREALDNETYSLAIMTPRCTWWDQGEHTPGSGTRQGIGPNTTARYTQCLTTHLTAFGSDFIVPPNSIDFSTVFAKFANLSDNAAVFSTVIVMFGIYFIIVLFVFKADKRDRVKWGVLPIADNKESDENFYLLTVYTGLKSGSGTSSKAGIILHGADGDTGPRPLAASKNQVFQRGNICSFLLSTTENLGQLTNVHVWHDNSGEGGDASWFLDRIVVGDIRRNKRYVFFCQRWLAVEMEDGKVDRFLSAAGRDELTNFSSVFHDKTRYVCYVFSENVGKEWRLRTSLARHLYGCARCKSGVCTPRLAVSGCVHRSLRKCDGHLWFSVASRPTRSHFTRVQRASCCLSLVFLTMITNAMFYRTDDSVRQQVYRLGPLVFTLSQVWISFVSTIIVFPVNFVIVYVFTKSRPRRRKTTPESASKYQVKGSFVQEAKERKQSGLPHWCVYIGWVLVFLSATGSAFFVILYSMEWGAEKSGEWLTSILLSIFQSVLLVQPLKVLLFAVIIAFIYKKIGKAEGMEEDALDEDEEFLPAPPDARQACVIALLTKWVGERAIGLNGMSTGMSLTHIYAHIPGNPWEDLSAPDGPTFCNPGAQNVRAPAMPHSSSAASRAADLATARALRLNELRMSTILWDVFKHFLAVAVVFYLAFSSMDTQGYYMEKSLKSRFPTFRKLQTIASKNNYYRLSFFPRTIKEWNELEPSVHTFDKFWTWSYTELQKGLFARSGSKLLDDQSYRVGVAAVKQFRSRQGICRTSVATFPHCKTDYSLQKYQDAEFAVGWRSLSDNSTSSFVRSMMSPWVFTPGSSLPYSGQVGTYTDGAYMFTIGTDARQAVLTMNHLQEHGWLDVFTEAVAVEINAYNANANLFAVITLLIEFVAGRGAKTSQNIHMFKLYSYVGTTGQLNIAFQIIFVILFVLSLIREGRKVAHQKKGYFSQPWNWLEFLRLLMCIAVMALFAAKEVMRGNYVDQLKDVEGHFISFRSIAIVSDVFTSFLAILVFVTTLQFMSLLSFNRLIGVFFHTLRNAAHKIATFSVMFLLILAAFSTTGFLVFGSEAENYMSFPSSAKTLLLQMFGNIDYDHEMSPGHVFISRLYFLSFVVAVVIVLSNMFVTILDDQLATSKSNPGGPGGDSDMSDFMVNRFLQFIGINTASVPPKVVNMPKMGKDVCCHAGTRMADKYEERRQEKALI
ncbi:Vacuolar protein sorting-associated protein 54, partial [Branchiostoma belcheri]